MNAIHISILFVWEDFSFYMAKMEIWVNLTWVIVDRSQVFSRESTLTLHYALAPKSLRTSRNFTSRVTLCRISLLSFVIDLYIDINHVIDGTGDISNLWNVSTFEIQIVNLLRKYLVSLESPPRQVRRCWEDWLPHVVKFAGDGLNGDPTSSNS